MIAETDRPVAHDAIPLVIDFGNAAPDDDPPPAGAAAEADGAPDDGDLSPGSFRCPQCRLTYGDGLYHGPAGHAPRTLCLDCWASAWGEYELRIRLGRSWRQLDAALFLLCQGFTHAEAGRILGLRRATVSDWVLELRRFPWRAPRWLDMLRDRRCGRRDWPPRAHAA
jgi:hypothetical protein